MIILINFDSWILLFNFAFIFIYTIIFCFYKFKIIIILSCFHFIVIQFLKVFSLNNFPCLSSHYFLYSIIIEHFHLLVYIFDFIL